MRSNIPDPSVSECSEKETEKETGTATDFRRAFKIRER
jgi:hypothetical protein